MTLRFATPQEFLEHVTTSKEADTDPKRFRTLDRDARIEPTLGPFCVRFHQKLEDHGAVNAAGPYLIFDAVSVTCVHPLSPTLAVDVGYSERYEPGEARGPVQEGEQFIKSLEFVPLQ